MIASNSGSIYTIEVGKYYKSGFFSLELVVKHLSAWHSSYCTTPEVSSSKIRRHTYQHSFPPHLLQLSTLSPLQHSLWGSLELLRGSLETIRDLENYLFRGLRTLPGHPKSRDTRQGSFVTDLQKANMLRSFFRYALGSKDVFLLI